MTTSDLYTIQLELVEIRKLLADIRKPTETEDDPYEYDEHMDLGFFGTEYGNTKNIFESADKEENMRLSDENMEKAVENIMTTDLRKVSKEPGPELKVPVSFELEEDLFLELAIAAHKKDMTFNDFIVYLIDEHKKEMLNNK